MKIDYKQLIKIEGKRIGGGAIDIKAKCSANTPEEMYAAVKAFADIMIKKLGGTERALAVFMQTLEVLEAEEPQLRVLAQPDLIN